MCLHRKTNPINRYQWESSVGDEAPDPSIHADSALSAAPVSDGSKPDKASRRGECPLTHTET
ncbi:hypothetical protein BCAS0773A [Burkholderia cenocepacia J2315]|uniref:Uncharacterized protein n=1 Tax=Burkholderia cenocepacia (strain ATCC BAA-245 / DSM 16553 / LMG 16656 / NCTC 13227 / J2315 / CF5610) TaxID=216591 RepID=B4EPG2_BURCJ|nr:hypothetical protein BCAS0773A [Burkholderia cenocepacia J2315]